MRDESNVSVHQLLMMRVHEVMTKEMKAEKDVITIKPSVLLRTNGRMRRMLKE